MWPNESGGMWSILKTIQYNWLLLHVPRNQWRKILSGICVRQWRWVFASEPRVLGGIG